MAHVLVAGVAVADFVFQVDALPIGPEKFRASDAEIVGGGCAANASVTIARAGGRALLAARLGDDPVGDLIVGDLEREGVDLSFVNRAEGAKSSFSSVYVDSSGERQIMNFRGSGLVDDPSWIGDAPAVDAILADNRWPPITMTALKLARQRNVPGIVDAEDSDDFDCLADASHVAFSALGLRRLTGETNLADGLRSAANRLSAWLCVTDGSADILVHHKGAVTSLPAFQIDVRDTLGAGDIWHGAFALRLAEGTTENEAIRFANAAAAIKCTRFGGRKGCPDRQHIETFLKERELCN